MTLRVPLQLGDALRDQLWHPIDGLLDRVATAHHPLARVRLGNAGKLRGVAAARYSRI